MDFHKFKTAVAQQFSRMSHHDLFRVDIDRDELWAEYLAAFPDGTNPIFRERTEHDCSCCRQFVKTMGGVVAIIDGQIQTIWDLPCDEPAYSAVAAAMSKLVRSRPIENVFLSTESAAGTDKNFEDTVNGVVTWEHFHVRIPSGRQGDDHNFVVGKDAIGPTLSEMRARHDVLLRSLTEITDDAVDTVRELIGQNSLYRGQEHIFAVNQFKKLKEQARGLTEAGLDALVWSAIGRLQPSVSKIRNTSIGTLLVDLSEGRDLEGAVKAFESVVAPANYKRPTALVTKAMIEKAKAKVEKLGLTSALERRYATLADVDVNDILFADRDARKSMAGDVFDDIAAAVPATPKNLDKVETVSIDRFIADILPRATSVEALFENRHRGNLVSLIAPIDPTAGRLFKWDNLFSWSYAGDVADSIKERVKQAGGDVTGDLCCRLAWFNHDDLDLHMVEPGGYEIYYGSRGSQSPAGGRLDVDMNAGHGTTREPVENIFYRSVRTMREGSYYLFVHQFQRRETGGVGFEVEVDILGTVHRFAYEKAMRHGERVDVATFRYSERDGLKIIKSLPASTVSKRVWGVDTETFQRVNVVMLSPNHWGGRGVGNRHYFFMLDGCQNEETARGFYNEFLAAELDPHRKVFEMVGNKMRTDDPANQLSGLGFSSTQRNDLLVRVTGAFTRTVRVTF